MTPRDATWRLNTISAALITEPDIVEILLHVTSGTRDALDASATGLLVETSEAGLTMLAASSRSSAEIEMYQTLVGDGPCLDALVQSEIVISTHPADLLQRWPAAGPVVVGAGFQAVISAPVRWRGVAFGALNTFFRSARSFSTDQIASATLAADLAALALVHHQHRPDLPAVRATLQSASDDHAVVYQACAVLVRQDRVSTDTALETLRATALKESTTLTSLAHNVLARTAGGQHWSS